MRKTAPAGSSGHAGTCKLCYHDVRVPTGGSRLGFVGAQLHHAASQTFAADATAGLDGVRRCIRIALQFIPGCRVNFVSTSRNLLCVQWEYLLCIGYAPTLT